MTSHRPVDNRATLTLTEMLTPFFILLDNSNDKKQITKVIVTHLPFGIASTLELKLAIIDRNQRLTLTDQKSFIREQVISLLERIVTKGTGFKTYSREDLIRWYNSDPFYLKYFSQPSEETFTINVNTQQQRLRLSEEQLIGIAYGLHAMKNQLTPHITIISSLTKSPIEIDRIVQNEGGYHHTMSSKNIMRPYRVDILSNSTFSPVYFAYPEFMQGLLSVAKWYQLPNRGEGILWQNLIANTPDGEQLLTI